LDKDYEEKYHNLEERNWWFVSRRRAILSLLKNTDKQARILDIGCAGGSLLNDLMNAGFENVTGTDVSAEAVAKCASRGLQVCQMDAHNLQFDPNQFDVIIASDTLEHLEFDEKALVNWHGILKSGGRILVFVPAYKFLWSGHDVINHHFRRYTKNGLAKRMQSAGFEVKRKGYWNFAAFFPTAIFRMLQRSRQAKDQLSGFGEFSNKILTGWMKIENEIFQATAFPCGVSVFVEAEKR
jgi:SAM-dependent methyltransferase